MRSLGSSLTGPAIRLLLPVAVYGALVQTASVQNPVAAAQTSLLAMTIAGVLCCLAILAPRTTAGAIALTSTAGAAFAAVVLTGQGPHRSAAVFLLLTTAVAWAASQLRLDAAKLDAPTVAALAFAGQFLVRADLLLPPLFDLRTPVSLFLLPLAASGAVVLLARSWGTHAALFAGAIGLLFGPGWNVTTTLSLISLAGGAFLADRILPVRVGDLATSCFRRVPWLQAWSAGLLFLAILLAAPPWHRSSPIEAGLELLSLPLRPTILVLLGVAAFFAFAPGVVRDVLKQRSRELRILVATALLGLGLYAAPSTVDVPISWQRATLSPSEPVWRAPLEGVSFQEIVLESRLTQGAVPDGEWVAMLRVRTDDGVVHRRRIVAGEHTALTDAEALSSRLSQLSGDGASYMRRFHARFPLEASAELIALRLNPDLPPETRWTVFRLELRR